MMLAIERDHSHDAARRPTPRRDERGSISVVVVSGAAIALVLTMGVADVGRALTAAARARAAADAAALAAAQELAFPSAGALPSDVAAGYAHANGAVLESCTCEPGTFDVRVLVRAPVGALFLLPDDRFASATARAVVDLPDG